MDCTTPDNETQASGGILDRPANGRAWAYHPDVYQELDRIPTPLRDRSQWTLWVYEPRTDGEKPTKIPYHVSMRYRASVSKPRSWAPLSSAVLSLVRHRLSYPHRQYGLGYVFNESDPFFGVDLDACRDPETGSIDEWAQAIISRIASYTEISPSGTGLKIFGQGTKPGPRCRIALSPNLEIYDRLRFFTFTGDQLPGTPHKIQPAQEPLNWLYRSTFPPEPKRTSRTVTTRRTPRASEGTPHGSCDSLPGDEAILNRIHESRGGPKFARLWRGDTSEQCGDRSAADLSLCNILAHFCGGDEITIDRLFRHSGLMRPKWDESRPEGSYGARTIQRAIEGTENFFGWDAPPSKEKQTSHFSI